MPTYDVFLQEPPLTGPTCSLEEKIMLEAPPQGSSIAITEPDGSQAVYYIQAVVEPAGDTHGKLFISFGKKKTAP